MTTVFRLTAVISLAALSLSVSTSRAAPAAVAPVVAATPAVATEAPEEDFGVAYDVRLEEIKSRFNLGVYLQASQFSFEGRSLLGNSIELDANYGITPRIAATVAVSQAITMTGGISVLYTGIRAAAGYAIRGSYLRSQSTVVINNQRSLAIVTGTSSLLAADVGAEQFVFNGTNRIMPATGGSFGIRYDRTFGRFRASLIGRYGMLLIATQTASMMSGGAGLIYTF